MRYGYPNQPAINITPASLSELLFIGYFATEERAENEAELKRLNERGICNEFIAAVVDKATDGLRLDASYWVGLFLDDNLYAPMVSERSRSHCLDGAHVGAWGIHKPLSRYDAHGPAWQDASNYFVLRIS